MAEDPYQILGLKKGASHDDIRKAYRKLAKQYHPDTNQGDPKAEAKFKNISGAYSFLDDGDKRARFDRGEIDGDGNPTFGGFSGAGRGGGGNPFGAGGNPFGGADPFGPGGPFEGMGGFAGSAGAGRAGAGRRNAGARNTQARNTQGSMGDNAAFQDILSEMFGAGGANMGRGGFEQARRGADVKAKVSVSLNQAVTGTKVDVTLVRDGARKTIKVAVPAGVESGQTLKLTGQGGEGSAGLPDGDLLVEVTVLADKHLTRDGSQLTLAWPVSLKEVLEGAQVQIPTPHGAVKVRLPKASLGKLRLKGKGAPVKMGASACGDFYVQPVLTLPDSVDGNSELAKLVDQWSHKDWVPSRD